MTTVLSIRLTASGSTSTPIAAVAGTSGACRRAAPVPVCAIHFTNARYAQPGVDAFIPDPADPPPPPTSAAEGITAAAAGNIYGAEVGPKDLKKYVKK